MRIGHRKICLSCGTKMKKLVIDTTKTVSYGCPKCFSMLGYKKGELLWWYVGGSSLSVVPKGMLLVVPEVPVDALGVCGQGTDAIRGLDGHLRALVMLE